MEGKLNVNGQLFIKRRGRFKPTHCPDREEYTRCGDWCPFFGEPVKPYPGWTMVEINLCGDHVLTFGKFTDERAVL